jgi:hypothetical protein
MTALTLARTGCPGIRAMISAIVLTAFRHAFPLFNFAAAAGMSAIFVRHFHHLLSYNVLLSSMSFVLSLLE